MKCPETIINLHIDDHWRREFCKKFTVLIISILTWQFPLCKTYAMTIIPSAVKADDCKILLAYQYLHNLEDASIMWFTNIDYVKILLWLEKSNKVDTNMIIERWSPLSLISPIYAIMVARLGSPLTQEEFTRGEQLWNEFMRNLVSWINLIAWDNTDFIQAREYFLKNILEIVKLDKSDYEKISNQFNKEINNENAIAQLCWMEKDDMNWIFNNILDNKIDNNYLPIEEHISQFNWMETSLDSSIDLKNYFYSLWFYSITDDFIKNYSDSSVGKEFKKANSHYNRLQKKFWYDTMQKELLFWPKEKNK